MEKSDIRDRIATFIGQEDISGLKAFHRELEVMNARAILAGTDDKLMKDVEFLVRSAIFIRDIGRGDDWKLQLRAAVGLLDSEPKTK